ncbi:CBM35 domain-containing protein [Amycolatopsis sp. NPDC051371]|uniref:CBM35 domain-containing protein n=1 Tax=Amycolatopsis sp. NPDC051371 TaxID=3155800 RepID=UPI00343A8F65
MRKPFSLLAAVAVVATFALAPPAGAATTRLEAESAALSGGAVAQSDHPGASGGRFVGGYVDGNRGAAKTDFAVTSTGGSTTLVLGYANGTGATRTLSLSIDGATRQISLPATANWDTWGQATTTATLSSGTHHVAYSFGTADNGNVNLDYLDVTAGSTGESGALEAESAVLAGGAAVATDHAGYTGSGFVGGYTDGNRGNAKTTFSVTATGATNLAVRYANGSGATQTLSLLIDGVKVRQVSFPTTPDWDTWATATETVTLSTGAHTVAYLYDTTDSGNLNLDSLTVSASTNTPAGPGEAEGGFLSSGAIAAIATPGYNGPGYVSGFDHVGARVIRTVVMPSAGTATATVRFANSSGANRVLAVSANGQDAGSVSLSSGTGWRTTTVSVPLRAGLNTLGLASTSATGGDVLVDSVTVGGETAAATRGATTSYTEYEAEAGTLSGGATTPAADRTYRTVSSEASGRRAVRLSGTGQSVAVTLTKPANALVVRFSIPDSADGTGSTAPLALYANGAKVKDLTLTSQYSWVYGDYPFSNTPSQGLAHRFFDEVRTTIGDFPAGTVLKLQKDSSATSTIDVDLVDAEQAPAAAPAPAGSLSITSYGAVPNNGSDATSAITSAIAAAQSQNKPLFVPAGTFRISAPISVANVKIFGAGPWSSVLQGTGLKGGFFATGSHVTIADLAIFGDNRTRDDTNGNAALEGDFGTGSLLQNIWIEHTKVGLWPDSGTDGLYAAGLRIRDTYADGVNIHAKNGVTNNVRVDQSVLRNTGDDALAMYSEGNAVTNGAFTANTVQSPMLANGIGIYGGTSNRAEDNLISDTVAASSGIAVSTRFDPVAFSGTTAIRRNTLTRTGGDEPNWKKPFGALQIFALTKDISAPVVVTDLTITDTIRQAIQVTDERLDPGAGTVGRKVTQLSLDKVTITGAGTYGIDLGSAGSGSVSNTSVTGAASGGLTNPGGFTLVRGPGNSGF